MNEQESQVTKTVREAVVKVASVGEDLTRKINNIIRDVMADTLSKVEPTKEKVEQVSQDVMKGVQEGLDEAKVKVDDARVFADGVTEGVRLSSERAAKFAAKTADEVIDEARAIGEKAVDFFQDVLKGFSEGVKEVKDNKEEPSKE